MHAEYFIICLKEHKPAGIDYNDTYIAYFLYNLISCRTSSFSYLKFLTKGLQVTGQNDFINTVQVDELYWLSIFLHKLF